MGPIFVDSIALAIINKNAIITGVGNELHLHSSASPTQVLDDDDLKLQNKVHGIKVDKYSNAQNLLVYGEREFILLRCACLNDIKLLHRAEISDWISAASFLNDGKEFVLLTAHSVLLRFTFLEEKCNLLERSSCSDKSTLYCAHLHGLTWGSLVVLEGNAFGELLIWQPVVTAKTNANNKLARAKLQHRFGAHNGVIFSIDYDENAHILITTSDDRSIRFWRVSDLLKNHSWINVQLQPLASGYGHVSRVFCGKLLQYDNEIFAITAGEDSYVCVWRSTGELVHKRRQQFGATIWNLSYNPPTIYTVGSTGNVLAFDFKAAVDAKKNPDGIFLAQITQKLSDENCAVYVAKIKFLTSGLIVGMTNTNKLIYMYSNLDGNWQNAEWKIIKNFNNKKITVLEVWQNELIAVCGYQCVTIFKVDAVQLTFTIIYHTTKIKLWNLIRSFQFLNSHTWLISDDLGYCYMLDMVQPNEYIKIIDINLPMCKERWLTTALLVSDDNYLLASNRQGNLLLYKRNLHAFEHVHTLKHPHGNLGATVLQVIENNENKILIRSAGRDGTLKFLAVHKLTSTLSLELSENIPLAWVENAILIAQPSDDDNDTLLMGFNDNHFVAWCESQDFLVQIPCGGGHRFWHYNITTDSTDLSRHLQLVFIQNRRVKYYQQRLFINNGEQHIKLPNRNKWHVRPCNMALLLFLKEHNTLISAGDDNHIKLFNFNIKEKEPIEKLKLHAHISNVRAIKLLEDQDTHLLISGGGRAQLCIHRLHLNVTSYRAQLIFNYTLQATPSLLSLQQQQQQEQQENLEEEICKKNNNFSLDPETRIMAIDAIKVENEKQLHLYLGCSDGYVRKLVLNAETYEIVLPQQELYLLCCVLQTKIIIEYQLILVATTDGILRFYDMQLNEAQKFEIQHHASGINALDVLVTYNENNVINRKLHIITGGDDQCISYSVLNINGQNSFVVEKQWILPHTCTAQVTAVCLAENGIYAYASGVDQQVLKISLDNGELIERKITSVADVKGMCLWQQNNSALIYGCGLQCVQFDNKTP